MIRALFGLIAFCAGLVLAFAAPVYFVKFLYEIFALDASFWYSIFVNVLECIFVEIIAYLVCVVAAAIASYSK